MFALKTGFAEIKKNKWLKWTPFIFLSFQFFFIELKCRKKSDRYIRAYSSLFKLWRYKHAHTQKGDCWRFIRLKTRVQHGDEINVSIFRFNMLYNLTSILKQFHSLILNWRQTKKGENLLLKLSACFVRFYLSHMKNDDWIFDECVCVRASLYLTEILETVGWKGALTYKGDKLFGQKITWRKTALANENEQSNASIGSN